MEKFIEEIKKLSVNLDKSEENKSKVYPESSAIESLFNYADKAVTSLKKDGVVSINLHRLPIDLVPLFFQFESRGEGFVLSTVKKYAFFMQSAENKIFIFGKMKRKGLKHSGNDKMQQLFNIDFTENNGNVTYFDSTGKEIKPDEIVLLALNWSLN